MPIALLLPALQLLQPMPGVITQGVRPGHPAIDIACAVGTEVRAAHDGRGQVERTYTLGTTMVLEGSDGLVTRYSHLESAMPAAEFRRGEVIGHCGSSGIWSTGPHLHFESNRPELLGDLVQEEPATLAATGGNPPTPTAIGGTPAALRLPR